MLDQPTSSPPALSVKDWMITIFITAIPVIGFIMLFVWAFGSNTNQNKSNWAKATLLWILIAIVLYTMLFVLFGAVFLTGTNDW